MSSDGIPVLYESGRKIRNTLMGEARHGRAWFLPKKDYPSGVSVKPYTPSNASSFDLTNAVIRDVLIKSFSRECVNNNCTLAGQRVLENPVTELSLHGTLCNPNSYKHLTASNQPDQTFLLRHAQLNSSYLVRLFDVLDDDKYIYALMEFCAGGELYQHVRANQSFYSLKNAKIFFVQLLNGLSAMHSLRIAHRDLSLENILLTSDLHLRIADFGLAWEMPANQTINQSINPTINDSRKQPVPRSIKELTQGVLIKDGVAVGKIQYMSPEMFSLGRYNPFANDIWACGVILWAMLTQSFPFTAPIASDPVFVAICSGRINVALCQWHKTPLDEAGLELFMHIFCEEEKRWTVEECLSSAFLRDTWQEQFLIRQSINQSNNLSVHPSSLSRNSSSSSSSSIDYNQSVNYNQSNNSYEADRPQTSPQSAPATFNQPHRQPSNSHSNNNHVFNQTNNPDGSHISQSATRSQQISQTNNPSINQTNHHSVSQPVERDSFSLDGTMRSINQHQSINHSNPLYPSFDTSCDLSLPIPSPVKL